MHLQKDWKRPQRIESENVDFRYYENYDPYPTEFTGEVFPHARLVMARTSIIKFLKKNGENSECEVLRLAFVFDDNKHFFEHQIWGARRDADGNWGDNPEALQDFLYICDKQKPGSTEKSVDRDWNDQKETIYPDICGQYFTLVIGKSGERLSNGRTYDNNYTAIFSKDGFSAVELELGDSAPTEWARAANRARKKYCEFRGIEFKPQYSEDKPATNVDKPVEKPSTNASTTPTAPVEQAKKPNPFGDDIPF